MDLRYENWDNLQLLVDEMKNNGFIAYDTAKSCKEVVKQLKMYFKVRFPKELNECHEKDSSWFETAYLTNDKDTPGFGIFFK